MRTEFATTTAISGGAAGADLIWADAAHDPQHTSGGTATTLRHARQLGRPVISCDVRHRRTTLLR
ncbi:hypothetical protein LZ318_30895 [Saccharopolyspora indica]|uniref:hypothetical protein n=1 Tax=Saccharopolyspora indica TaxID=1229659 RepID=UPI0022EA28C0|nr:hypothetical protein [Saccharopolyspora indica]MDA3644359.1 hypothetical protein [Saccharopolyspora indica]